MENGLQKFGGDGKITNLWKQPGGTLAKVGLWVMGGSVLWGIYKALPYLIAFTQNVFTLTLLMLGLGCILYVVFSPEMRKILKLLYLQICRKITGLIVEIDPIAILENSINEMKKKLQTVKKRITEIGSTLAGMENKQKEYKKEFETNVNRVKAIKEKLMKDNDEKTRMALNGQLTIAQNDITMLDEQIKAQADRITKTKRYLEILEKLEIAATTKIKVAENTVSHKKDEYEQAKKMKSAVQSLTSIFSSSWLTKSMEEQMALNVVSNTINDSIAEMNRLLDGSNDILINYDISSMANASKVDEIIANYDHNGFESFKALQDNGEYMPGMLQEEPVKIKENKYF
jgi:predicted  nucleic acid-binding Zn-ribbon protein